MHFEWLLKLKKNQHVQARRGSLKCDGRALTLACKMLGILWRTDETEIHIPFALICLKVMTSEAAQRTTVFRSGKFSQKFRFEYFFWFLIEAGKWPRNKQGISKTSLKCKMLRNLSNGPQKALHHSQFEDQLSHEKVFKSFNRVP